MRASPGTLPPAAPSGFTLGTAIISAKREQSGEDKRDMRAD
jgi:hypothetical protein